VEINKAKILAIEIELKKLAEAEAYALRALSIGFQRQKEKLKEELKKLKSSSIKKASLEVSE